MFSAAASGSSRYPGAGPRRGPDILHEPPAVAAQLTNADIWRARPILVSGTTPAVWAVKYDGDPVGSPSLIPTTHPRPGWVRPPEIF